MPNKDLADFLISEPSNRHVAYMLSQRSNADFAEDHLDAKSFLPRHAAPNASMATMFENYALTNINAADPCALPFQMRSRVFSAMQVVLWMQFDCRNPIYHL